MTLDELRERLTELDRELLALVAERQRLSSDVATVKQATGLPTRDFQRERDVLLNARRTADQLGVAPATAESLLRLLIRDSLTTQEQAQVAARGRGTGRAALIIGGAGKMGRWFAEFMSSQGYRVVVADPQAAASDYERHTDWRKLELDHDFIVVATPLKIANEVLIELAQRRPRGVIFDIGSLKTPLRRGLTALRDAGCAVSSVHPMFGPDTALLSGRHVICCDVGSAAANAEAQSLFASTMAEQVTMSLDEHDRLIAYVLGLSHALNIAFYTALADSGEAAPKLARMSSTTFDAQLEVAGRVSEESPDLYFEIQRLNEYGAESLQALLTAVQRIVTAVAGGDAAEFARMMRRGREYLAGRARQR